MNSTYKKLKPLKRTTRTRRNSKLTQPQFCRHPLSKRKKLNNNLPCQGSDATGKVALKSAITRPAGALMGVESQASDRMRISVPKTARKKAKKRVSKFEGAFTNDSV